VGEIRKMKRTKALLIRVVISKDRYRPTSDQIACLASFAQGTSGSGGLIVYREKEIKQSDEPLFRKSYRPSAP
jgi:hypothetical protein